MTTSQERERGKGIVVQTPGGEYVRVALMDENDEYLNLSEHPEEGVFGYENAENSITMFLEEP